MDIPKEIETKLRTSTAEKHPGSICIANYKGGVGKTTVTTLLGYYLAKTGKKVLLIDIDPQCSLSLAVGFDPSVVSVTDFTIYNMVKPTRWGKIHKVKFSDYVDDVPDRFAPNTLKIIKGSFDVDDLDIKVIQAIKDSDRTKHELFLYCLNLINAFDEFDYVLVDCPPNKMFLTQAMLRACSYYLPVTIPDRISVYGMPRLMRWVKEIPKELKPRMLGYVLNTVNRSGGNEFGTVNQQQAMTSLASTIRSDLDTKERTVIGSHPVLAYLPRLDVISKFLSQGDDKKARFDFSNSTSDQRTVNEIMMNFIKLVEKRIRDYA